MTEEHLENREAGVQGRGEHAKASALTTTRRRLLASSSGAALTLSLIPITSCARPPADPLGEPFDDGTFFDDGTGWVE